MKTKLKRRKQRKAIKRWLREAGEMVSKESGIECSLSLKPEFYEEVNRDIKKAP